jgi:hypothetical protein
VVAQLSSLDGRRESTSLMCISSMGEPRCLAIGNQAAVARSPIRQFLAGLLPVGERRLVAPIVQACHRAQMRFSAHEGLNRIPFPPGSKGPPCVVRVGDDVSRFRIAESLLAGGERSECGLTGWLVDVDNNAGAGRPGFDEPESDRRVPFREQPLATSQDERVKPESILIDEAVLDQRLGEVAAAVDLEFPASLGLQLYDLFHRVALDQP